MLREFRIHEPHTVQEASGLLAEFGPEATVYAGGTELLLLMKEGITHYPHLVNVKTIPGLDTIRVEAEGQSLRIGPLATHRALERSEMVREHAPLLAEVERTVANPRVRATGTIGGNLCFAEPHSDPATFLMARGARLELTSAGGQRDVSVDDFFVDVLQTAREHDEILTGIRLPLRPDGVRGSYQKFRTHERPTATVAVLVGLTEGVVTEARVAIGSVGPIPVRVPEAEAALEGEPPGEAAFEAAGEAAYRAADPVDDIYGTADYKRHLVRVLMERALWEATNGTQGAVD